jgi:branched-chain amino acid transport system ATP-binding protein
MDTVMKGVKRSGAATLFVEHDMEIVSRYATRVIAFYDGHVIADGPTEEALLDPKVREYIIGSELHRQSAEGQSHAAN